MRRASPPRPELTGSRARSLARLLAVGLGLLIAVVFWGESPPPTNDGPHASPETSRSTPHPSGPGVVSPPSEARETPGIPPERPVPPEAPEEPEPIATSTDAETVRESFRAALQAMGHTPSEGQLIQMTEAALRIRAARAALAALRYEAGHGQDLRRLRDEIAQAGADFETAAGMSLTDLTVKTTEGGLSPRPSEGPETDVVFERLPGPRE